MTIFITGISSFVGSNLARIFRAAGHRVRGSSTRAELNGEVVCYRFGDPIPSTFFEGIDVVVHAAWSLDPADGDLNQEATRSLVVMARKRSVRRQIFLSSQSAHINAVSTYGRAKFLVESYFETQNGDVIVRPGLVVGEGGLFRRTYDLVKRSRLIPLIGGGEFAMPLIGIEDLGESLLRLLNGSFEPTPLNFYYGHVPSQREFLKDLVACKKWKRIFVTIPGPVAVATLSLCELLKIPTPVSKESVTAALQNKIVPELSDLERFLGEARSYSALMNSISKMT